MKKEHLLQKIFTTMKLHFRYKFSETDYKILNNIFPILEMKHIYVQDIRRRKSIKKKQDTDARGIISRIT